MNRFVQGLAGLLALYCGTVLAQQSPPDSQTSQSSGASSAAPTASPIEQLGSEFHNSIELLRNRFRVDHNVSELTLVFFREYGSAPVVLVQPDGSKIFQSQVQEMGEDASIYWFDTETYDLIRIKDPVAGPWQAVGQVLPNSRVMVLSELQLHAEPLPKMIFSGEILKQTAYLTNGDEPIDFNQFRDVVELTIELVSTNNPNFDNFGADSELVATFEDNGRGMDEAPLDGVFTGQFNLSVPAGEWTPIFRVTTPMFTREQVDPVLRLYPNPVQLTVKQDNGEDGYHTLTIDVARDLVDIESLLIDGKIRYPNGDLQNFSLTEPSSEARTHKIIAYEEGIFRVKLTAYGTTTDGRDFILDVPEFTFLGEFPEPEPDPALTADMAELPEAMDIDAESLLMSPPATEFSEADLYSEPEEEAMPTSTLMFLLVAVNGTILIIGGGVIGFIFWRRNKSA